LTGKKRKNYAEQQTNFDNLQMLISLIKQDQEGVPTQRPQAPLDDEGSEEDEEDYDEDDKSEERMAQMTTPDTRPAGKRPIKKTAKMESYT
jgi:hypothetical protein